MSSKGLVGSGTGLARKVWYPGGGRLTPSPPWNCPPGVNQIGGSLSSGLPRLIPVAKSGGYKPDIAVSRLFGPRDTPEEQSARTRVVDTRPCQTQPYQFLRNHTYQTLPYQTPPYKTKRGLVDPGGVVGIW